MDIDKIKKLETNSNLIKKYAGVAAFGKNRIVYLPLLIGIALLIFLISAFFENLISTIGVTTIAILSIICLVCFVLVKIITDTTKKKLISETKLASICVGKKVFGNDVNDSYYVIYTTTENRHDELFIEQIVEKIYQSIENPQSKIDKKVASLFRIDFAKPNEFAISLPLEFTDNKLVWRKQISLTGISENIKQQILKDNDKLPLIALVHDNARFLIEYYNE